MCTVGNKIHGVIYSMIKNIKELFSERGLIRTIDKANYIIRGSQYNNSESLGNGGSLKFAHVTYCTAPNAGDTVLSQCVRKTIESRYKLAKWEIIPVQSEVNKDTIKKINECNMIIIGGGGLFLPDTNANTISGWQWAISKELLEQIEIPVCVYTVGYNYFRGQETNNLFKESLCALAEKSSFFGLRNMGSLRAIRGLLPENLATKVSFQPCTTTVIRHLYGDKIAAKKNTRSVAVNMAFDRSNLRFGEHKDTVLKQVARAIKEIEDKGYKVYYVCHCWDDDKFLPYLKEMKVRYELVDLSRKFPPDVYDFYNHIDVVLGMRGHAQMIPFGLNCEIISLGTHDKMKWFLEDINADDWYIDLFDDVENVSDRIMDKFCEIHETNREKTRNRLMKEQENLWNITQNNLEKLGGGYR